MPRTEGVSSSSRVRRILFSPRPTSVSFWPGLRPSAEAIWVTRTFFSSDIGTLLHPGRRLALAKQVGDLLATARRDGTGARTTGECRECRLHHVMRVAAADALGHHIAD